MTSTAELIDAYDSLNPFERVVLQLLSVMYEPAHPTLIVTCLRKLDILGMRGNRPTTAGVNHTMAKLEEAGFLTESHQCRLDIVETICRRVVEEGLFTRFSDTVRGEAPASYFYGKWSTRCWRGVRELRAGIYGQDFALVEQALAFLDNHCEDVPTPVPPIVQVVSRPFDRAWFRTLPPSFQFFLLDRLLLYARQQVHDVRELIDYLEDDKELGRLDGDERLPFLRLLLNHYLITGDIDSAKAMLASHTDAFAATGAGGTIALLTGNYDAAARYYEEDMQHLQAIAQTESAAFFGIHGVFHTLCLIIGAESNRLHDAAALIAVALSHYSEGPEATAYKRLAELVDNRSRTLQPTEETETNQQQTRAYDSFTALFTGLTQFWLNSHVEEDMHSILVDFYRRAHDCGYNFLTLCFADLLARTVQDPTEYREVVSDIEERTGLRPFLNAIEPEEPWKRSLQALISISNGAVSDQTDLDTRIVWLVDYHNVTFNLRPREQKRGNDGQWSRGRPISLERLKGATKLPYLSMQDRKICLTIRRDEPEDSQPGYYFDQSKLLPALVGHPLLFLHDSPTTPVEFVSAEPELLVEERGDFLHINFSLPITAENVLLLRDTPTRFKVIKISENHRRIAQITGPDGLTVPRDASEQVLTAIGNISSFMTVHSAIAVDAHSREAQDITLVEADPTIYIHMLPFGNGFRLEMFVKPFKEGSHYLKPGQGVENMMAEVGGKRLQTRRNLAEEERRAREVEELCPILDLAIDLEQGNDREWHLHDPDDCLQALLELQDISDRVIIEWPEGEKLTVAHRASFGNLNLKIRTNRQNWFGFSGELVLDQDVVIDLKEFLTRLRDTPGRFIQISDGQFVALTQEFRNRLDELDNFSDDSHADDKEVMIHPLAALPLENLTALAQTTADSFWYDQRTMVRESAHYAPPLPSTLQANLRDYQVEGYHWLARLARWGVGGCLADDMGLGKTLQSLAIILLRASSGPSLVVAPTSVSTNWMSEVSRFTPTLRIRQLTGKNRRKTIENMGKFDLLITTYTLLQQEIEPLSDVQWQTIVLDEAQAIKNAATKRSQAAMSLKGGFRIITTGTPIENHLGELWNLFQFINPGLLGSHKQFNERFAIPIERFNDREARLRLKKLIRPFILRRIKSEVLEELPSRTEVTLEVTMSEEEAHFYEALRQNAIDLLEKTTDTRGRHLQILTEIMRLRQACCNARLVSPKSDLPSAKLEVFASLIDELIGSRHKALVFSQFIGHLDIIREYLDKQKISYQYLDGSTSSKARRERVEAFQSGIGDLFLISLKAGGLGLNLTAADYVIHMDPWWNPAVEDQASDRAHRIGQTRPVTIYRLVCKHTIEEKIVKLHQEKRDLADSLLEGTDMSARLSAEELIQLIKER